MLGTGTPTAMVNVLVIAWAGFLCGAALYACWRAARSSNRERTASIAGGHTLLLRPCAGAEHDLARTLTSLPHDASALSLTVRFAIGSLGDPAASAAIAAVRAIEARGVAASIVLTGSGGPNNKAHQLAIAMAGAGADFTHVVVADSDVDLASASLRELLEPLADPRVGATWAPPVEVNAITLADRASAAVLDASLHAFAMLAALDAATMVGKLFAMRTADLEAIGGFDSLRSHLGEDAEVSRRLRARGLHVRVTGTPARSTARRRSPRAVLARYARWLWVVRAQRSALLVTYPFFLAPLPAMILAASVVRDHFTGIALVVAFAARIAVAAIARATSKRPTQWATLPIDAVLGDILLVAAWARTLCARRLHWRASRLRVTPAGTIVADD